MRPWVILATTGILFGLATSAVDHGHGPGAGYLANVIGADWGWVLAGLAAAWPGRTVVDAMLRAFVLLGCADASYYLLESLLGTYDRPSGFAAGTLAVKALLFLVITAVTAAGLGIIVIVARRGGAAGTAAALVVPAFVVLQTSLQSTSGSPDLTRVNAIAGPVAIAAMVAIAVVGAARWLRDRRPFPD